MAIEDVISRDATNWSRGRDVDLPRGRQLREAVDQRDPRLKIYEAAWNSGHPYIVEFAGLQMQAVRLPAEAMALAEDWRQRAAKGEWDSELARPTPAPPALEP
jgi:hypothetical protein